MDAEERYSDLIGEVRAMREELRALGMMGVGVAEVRGRPPVWWGNWEGGALPE
jgi:hypothetical protein